MVPTTCYEQLVNIDRICQPITPLPEWWLTKNWLTRNNQAQLIRLAEGSWTREHTISTTYTPRLTSVTDENLWLPITPDERFCFEIRHYCECPLWQLQVTCPVDLCLGEVCLGHPNALCRVNNCDRCTIEWYDVTTGKVVECQSSDCVDDNGDTHIIGSVWKKDLCSSCRCEVGQVISCDSVPCVDTLCTHPFKPEDECCPICNDCWYFRRQIRNGDEFNPFDEPCESCACRDDDDDDGGGDDDDDDDINDESDDNCDNDHIGDDLDNDNGDSCLYEGEDYMTGDTWTTSDGCKECTCNLGDVDCVNIVECTTQCDHGAIRAGQCCSPCTDCTYNNQFIRNGVKFAANGDLCNQCICQDGNIICQREECSPIDCVETETPDGSCCPVCKGCIDSSGRRYEHNDEWTPADDDCNVCRCREGRIDCERERCTLTCRHPIPEPDSCCPKCEGCLYQGQTYQNGDFVDDSNSCRNCICRNGNVECVDIECPQLGCPNPVFIPGSCCPICEDCLYEGQTFKNGETFTAPRQPCLECTCRNTQVNCRRVDQECSPDCMHPGRMADICCPVCDICEYERRNYRNGAVFRPDGGDICDLCTCVDGTVTCQTEVCPPLECRNPVQKPDKCCMECDVCIADGVEYAEGDVWDSVTDQCAVCTCTNTRVRCRNKDCPTPECRHPAQLAHNCCPVCENCLYDRRLFRNGQEFRDPLNPCNECICTDGNVRCERVDCPVLNCENQFTPEGECCPQCSETNCEHLGQSYRNRERFTNPSDSCEECMCIDGEVTCNRKPCPAVRCPYPRRGQCCDMCDGCTYNGVTYTTGETFSDPRERCKECTCQDGFVECSSITCDDVTCSHPITRPGDCCPVCEDCVYEGRRLGNGQTFSDPTDPCKTCTCETVYIMVRGIPMEIHSEILMMIARPVDVLMVMLTVLPEHVHQFSVQIPAEIAVTAPSVKDGDVNCAPLPCPPVTCDNPMSVCQFPTQTLAKTVHVSMVNGTVLIRTVQQCSVHIQYRGSAVQSVQDGNVNCRRQRCEIANCGFPAIDQCGCQTCEACELLGDRYSDGEIFDDPRQPCYVCQCLNGEVNCQQEICPPALCAEPVSELGGCCPICIQDSCVVNGVTYEEGDSWISPDDICEEYCIHGGRSHLDGSQWTSTLDPCDDCICQGGEVKCVRKACPQVRCSRPILKPGECCQECPDTCEVDGRTYEEGDTWISPDDQCLQCLCLTAVAQCQCLANVVKSVEAVFTMVRSMLMKAGGLLFLIPVNSVNALQYMLGEVFDVNDCISCVCKDGDVQCVTQECPTLDCPYTTKDPGQCCERCRGCMVNGVEFADGESWVSDINPCLSCSCRNGVENCIEIRCAIPESCAQVVTLPGQCCPLCQGCAYNGVTYKNGETFQPIGQPCETCTCESGNLNCYQMTCPPETSCPSSLLEPPSPGECCGKCQNSCYVEPDNKSYKDGETWVDPDTNVTCHLGETVYQITIVQPNERWIKDDCTTCECKFGDVRCKTTTCRKIACQADETPTYTPGVCCPTCQPKPATCLAFGDPHYRTFDGKMIHFQGTCKYVMAMDCENQDYIVEVQNDDRGAFGAVSWTQEVTIKVSGLEIHLGQSGLVKVNGQAIVLPYLRDPFLYIEMRAGNNFFVNTDIGLNVHWDGSSRLEVSIPGTYSGRSCGLCGNFNSYPQDDLRMRSGEITTSVSKFGNSWKVFEPEQETCEDARDIDPCTEAGYRARKLANAKCAVLKSSRFSKCHRFIQPEAYFASCVYDMCACGSDDSCLCDVLSAYAAECRQSGVALNWRSTSLCAIQCPEERGLIFDECGPRCPRTCENKDVPLGVIEAQCFRPCVPGCQCRADKVLFDARCIDPDDCPEILYGNNVTLS
ncbi:kielin/chordin-like protein [Ptychodera flava]|uniref:kielin/chordin-like protein n=1 Tax=Ptychodera flava TaxID=63121 RepID=UPI003969FEBD